MVHQGNSIIVHITIVSYSVWCSTHIRSIASPLCPIPSGVVRIFVALQVHCLLFQSTFLAIVLLYVHNMMNIMNDM